MIRDAETGEPLTFTKSKWDAVEGRVNLDYRSIILMGTGAMSIKSTANGTGLSREMLFDTTSDESAEDENCDLDINENSNPLFVKFLRDGPLNKMSHQRYNVKTGEIDPDPRILREERLRLRDLHRAEAERKRLEEKETDELELNKSEQELANNVLNAWNCRKLFGLHTPPLTGTSTPVRQPSLEDADGQRSLPSLDNSFIHALSPGNSEYSSRTSTPTRRSPSRSRIGSREGSFKGNKGYRSPHRRKKGRGGTGLTSSVLDDNRQGINSGANYASFQLNADIEFENLQRVFFNELYNKAAEIDRIRHPIPLLYDKTQEEVDRIHIDDDKRRLELVNHCKELAYMKARNIRDLKQAHKDEEEREFKREAHAAEWPPNSVTGKELRKRHAEEREVAKTYLNTLQHDNEVLLIRKMRQYRLLW